ncbi:uncharacterized protein LOC105446108 [Strongylocentrotus purpuratus]|uniref:Zinc finger PHD-type domain-containing protein n=1 Tax=Strongylocentrotus purpuratus TaxID=7668 RepID=A0A7M7HME3_STRPU|nr:uncharacterized protein LOC105446108 [Strongylocentrotus purpuratus]
MAKAVVAKVWHQLPLNTVADIINADVNDEEFCICKRKTQEDMIECTNVECERGRWFHKTCVNTTEVEGDWFCSLECSSSGQSAFCLCRKKTSEILTLTCSNADCPNGNKFHPSCVRWTGNPSDITDESTWFCPHCKTSTDSLASYLASVTWRCLLNEALRDAEREGDGEAMMSHWRIYMPELFKRRHPHYIKAAHRMLAGVAGCLAERIRNEIVHNRTININGGAGRNVALDFFIEQLNHHFKEFLRHCGGRYTPQTIQRAGKLCGALGKELDDKFIQEVCDSAGFGGQTKPNNRFERYKKDVSEFLIEFKKDNLFCTEEGRCVPSLLNYAYSCNSMSYQEATDMKSKILKFNEEFDNELSLGSLP